MIKRKMKTGQKRRKFQ